MKRVLVGVVVAAWSATAFAQTGEAVNPPPVTAPPAAPNAPTPSPGAAPTGTTPSVPPQSYYPSAYPQPYPQPYPAPSYPPAPPTGPGVAPYPAPVYAYPPPYPLPVYEPPEPPQPPPPMTTFSLTIAPLYLLLPVVAVTGELRLGTQGGVALIAGGGRVTQTQDNIKVTLHVYEVGGQLRYYVTGNFRRGMHVGAELLYLYVNGSLEDITGVAKGLAMGPFFGWKTTSYAGFTFEVQGGVEIVTSGTKVTDSNGGSTSSTVDYVPLVNLNIGWSF